MLKKIHDLLIYWDFTSWFYMNTQWVNDFFDVLMPFIRNQWTWAPLYLFLIIFMPMNYGRKGWMWCIFFLLTFAIGDYVSASIIKPHYIRMRPCNNPYIKDIVHLLVPCGSGYSFPSSHATNHFALAIFSGRTLGRHFKWVWAVALLWAFSVAYAQVYVGVHFPGDVLVGAILGIVAGLLTSYIYRRVYKQLEVVSVH